MGGGNRVQAAQKLLAVVFAALLSLPINLVAGELPDALRDRSGPEPQEEG